MVYKMVKEILVIPSLVLLPIGGYLLSSPLLFLGSLILALGAALNLLVLFSENGQMPVLLPPDAPTIPDDTVTHFFVDDDDLDFIKYGRLIDRIHLGSSTYSIGDFFLLAGGAVALIGCLFRILIILMACYASL